MTDNVAVLQGFTREIEASSTEYDFNLLVKPDTDLGERFKAWDMDEQEFIWVNGWLFVCEDVVPAPKPDITAAHRKFFEEGGWN